MIRANPQEIKNSALEYIRRGWAPIDIPFRQKAPTRNGWQQLRMNDALAQVLFNGTVKNIGVILGEPSGWLVDVDLDHPKAVQLAGTYLPDTAAVFGRPGKRSSHRLYRASRPVATHQRKHDALGMIVELRSTGGQTVFPPSTHPSGEKIEWESGGDPVVVDPDDLRRYVDELADAVLRAEGIDPTPPPQPQTAATTTPPTAGRLSPVDRAERYLAKCGPAISGSGGHNVTYHVACVLIGGFGLSADDARPVLQRWNSTCQPPWSDKELEHKLTDAAKATAGEQRGYLLTSGRYPGRNEELRKFLVEHPVDDQKEAKFPAVYTFKDFEKRYPKLRPEVIHGLLRQGETLNLISVSKNGKSWGVADLSLSGATGRRWLDSFDVEPGEVLILDNELHPETLRYRIETVARARGIDFSEFEDRLSIVCFRGQLVDIFELAPFIEQFEQGRFRLVVMDALYRFQGESIDENKNNDMARMYNALDQYAARLGSSIVCVHHASKGSQSGKSVTEVGSGAGAQSRAADTHLVLRPHVEDGAVVLEAVCRSFPPVEPRVLRWEWPLWKLATDLDPTALKQESAKQQQTRDTKIQDVCQRILDTFNHFPEGATKTRIRDRVGATRTFDEAWQLACNSGQLTECKVRGENRQEYDGFKRVYDKGQERPPSPVAPVTLF